MSDRLTRIISNYETKLRLGAVGRLSQAEINSRVGRFTHAAVAEHVVYLQVRQILCSHGVSTMMFPYYHSFSRELGKLTRQETSPEIRQQEMAVLLAKWVMRGLLQPALLDIAWNIFNLEMPAPPEAAPNEKQGEGG
jgi:hypothetical protein